MIKIYGYELRRLIVNKFFLGMLLVCLFVSWQILQNETILGVAHTAPFSPWSFGSYMSKVAPLLMVGLLFMLHTLFSQKAVRVSSLSAATPVNPSVYMLVKCAAIATAWLLMAMIVAALGTGYLLHAFGQAVQIEQFMLPLVVVLLPALIFVLGLGLLAGRIHPVLIFVLIPLVIAVDMLPIADGARLLAGSYFSRFPLMAGTLDPTFTLSFGMAMGRLIYLVSGSALIIIALPKSRRYHIVK